MNEKQKLVETLKDSDHCPAHRNCEICGYRNNNSGQCYLMDLTDRLLADGWVLGRNRNKVVVEIDVDGVVANLLGNNTMKSELHDCLPNWSEDIIDDYDMSQLKKLNPIAYSKIFALFAQPAYIKTLDMYGGVVQSCRRLLEEGNIEIHFHTVINTSEECKQARIAWIENLIRLLQVRNKEEKIKYTVDFGKKTMLNFSDYLIEDCPKNIEQSNAKVKILIRKNYNYEWAMRHPEVIAVGSFIEAVDWICNHNY